MLRDSFRPRIAVIGAGVSGIVSGVQIQKQLGSDIDFTIYEKENDFGGTWLLNRYPGCACDVYSHAYSFSFELNPNWSKSYADAHEIRSYMQKVARKYNLYAHAMFGHELRSAVWDDSKMEWELTFAVATEPSSAEPKTISVRHNVFISGGGGLYYPRLPNIPGFDTFNGEIAHSARWPLHEMDLQGKDVAIIGTGASATQIVEVISDKCHKLTIYQRSPTWYPKKDLFVYPEWAKLLFRYVPFAMRLYRMYRFFFLEAFWNFHIRDSALQRVIREKFIEDLAQSVPDSTLRSKLLPDFPVGAKRIIPQVTYLSILQKPTTELVSAKDEKIVEVGVDGVFTEVVGPKSSQQDPPSERVFRRHDVIICATGFETSFASDKVKIIGREGLTRVEKWRQVTGENGLAAHYKTIMTSGFPNYFMLFGPNSTINTSVIFIIECQVDLIMFIMRKMMKHNIYAVDPKEEAQWSYTLQNWEALRRTVWNGVAAWYNPEGRTDGRWPSTFAYPGRTLWWETRSTDLQKDYNLVDSTGEPTKRILSQLSWSVIGIGVATILVGAILKRNKTF
ncbi:FAD/NAD(P)-binding domain-containing protein [Gonapodya prolifera JEL478]|uniref:FAD/NAD(P)-binding domain-containing protein n=1 Tax=Gonapodya prolifera (strain JEL478) TaxID=1344416 RepID=A0A139AZ12_GONPJ|nr:FAD/NAD(P)-binding domain-containing protein [Gonapodya prolifera JEL478]|eukprot:KXS21793.1 FAD/NAD(P)-binding domain-containing protein [Gonapodya prolifera JEL478]